MRLISPLLAVGLLMNLTSFIAKADLSPYISNDQSLVYSSISDITWTQDAALFKTLYEADHTLVSRITSVTPTDNDPSRGLQIIDSGDFNTEEGRMTWWGANAFINFLNHINYGGISQWRLPTSNAVFGYNGTAGNELGQLFYGELGGTEGRSIPDTEIFNNEQAYAYWSGKENASNTGSAWYFHTYFGGQYFYGKHYLFHVWAVSSESMFGVPVPVPASIWMFGAGLLGLIGFKRGGTLKPRVFRC